MKNKLNTSLSLRKVLLSALVAAPLATLPAPLWALPINPAHPSWNPAAPNVVYPTTTTFFQSGTTSLQISDTVTNRLVLKWNEFGSGSSPINAGETIFWTLPSTTSAVLNMVSTGATLVNGTLQSNGTIFIVNPNGITLSGTSAVNAAGLGLSTAAENEFNFLATGAPGLGSLSTATAAVSALGTISVGTTGNVMLAGAGVNVAGTINAGTLTINSNSAGTVQLASGGTLTVGTLATAATGITDFVAGTGNVAINSNGGNVVLSSASATEIRGGELTINTTGATVNGSISQGAGALTIGDAPNATTAGTDSNLNITAGTGTVTLGNVNVQGTNVNRVNVTITSAGTTAITVADDVRLMASTISGNLTLASTNEDIQSGGASTVTGLVTLNAGTANKDITFNSVGDLNFAASATALTVHTTNAGSDITLISGGSIVLPAISVGGNLTVTAASNITQQAATAILQPTTNRRAKFESTAGAITLDNTGNDFTRVQLVGAPAGVTLRDLDDVTIFNGTDVTGNATINANAIILGAEASDTVTFNGNLTLNAGAGGTVSLTLVSGGTGYTAAPTFTLSSGGGGTTTLTVTTGTSSVPITAAGTGFTSAPTVAFSSGTAAATATLALNALALSGGTGYTAGNTFVVSGGGSTSPALVTVTSVDGVTGAITGVSVTSPGAGFTDMTTVTVSPATVSGTGATIGAATGQLGTINVTAGGTGYTTTPTVTLTGGGGTGATVGQPLGQVEALTLVTQPTSFVTTPAVTFSSGTASATAAATVPAGAGVTDNSNNVKVTGLTQINTLGVVTIDGGASGSAIGLNHNFGLINVNQGGSTAADPATGASITLYEATTLNLGAITTGGKLRAYSSGGEVIDTGPIVAGGAEFGAGTAAAPGNITIDSAGTVISGTIAILDDVALVTNSPANGGPVIGTYLANNVSITTAGSINLASIMSPATELGLPGTLTLSATGAGSDIIFGGAVGVAGLTTLSAADAITANNSGNALGTVNVTAGGNVNVRSNDTRPLVINATLTQNAAGNTATFRGDGGLQIGSVNSDYTGLVTFQAAGNFSLTDNVNGMRVFGPVNFTAAQNITINNTGHSFGLVSASTTDRNGSITIVESGGLRLGTVTTNGRGNFTATSTTGDILQDVTQNGIRLGNGEIGTGTFNAPMGNITLNDNDLTGNVNSMAIVNATAGGNLVINNPRTGQVGQVVLGNITAGGSLTVDAATTHTAGVAGASVPNNIEQTSNGRINAFGISTFVTSGAAAITLGNTGNRLGGVIASTGSGNITITESTTLNLLSILTTGSLIATSENGSIIDSAFTTPAPFVNAVNAPIATFSAPNGNVTLGLATNNFATVGFTTGGNVSILDSAGNTTLAASTIGGTLDVINTAASGNINQSGALAVAGNVTLTTNGGGIDMSNLANMFGGIRFTAGAAGVLIAENTTLNLRGGSTSTGPVQLVTNGDFITSGAGASSITNNLTIQAQGTIIPGAGSLLVTGVFTVFSPSLKDLRNLSKSGNLLNRDPVNLGSGPYEGPSL